MREDASRRGFLRFAGAGGLAVAGLGAGSPVAGAEPNGDPAFARLPQESGAGRLEVVATFDELMLTGVTVSRSGRVFVNFPRWGDHVPFTVAEIVGGEPVAFPDQGINQPRPHQPSGSLLSVQSVVVDPADRLWMLDTGSIEFGPTSYGGPKLVGVDLRRDEVFRTILLPQDVALPTSYLNDVRFDLRRGTGGMAFITDSSDKGPNGIIAVDLESGRNWRRLHDHPSTVAEPGFLPLVEARPHKRRPADGPEASITTGSDGIALSEQGQWLYYCPLASRRLYSVSLDALADSATTGQEVAATVVDLGDKGGAADGLESDARGGVYLTNYEHNALLRRAPDGTINTLVHDPRLLWPDTLCLADDGYLYVSANQLHRQPDYQHGRDLRRPPYVLFRVWAGVEPVRLR